MKQENARVDLVMLVIADSMKQSEMQMNQMMENAVDDLKGMGPCIF